MRSNIMKTLIFFSGLFLCLGACYHQRVQFKDERSTPYKVKIQNENNQMDKETPQEGVKENTTIEINDPNPPENGSWFPWLN